MEESINYKRLYELSIIEKKKFGAIPTYAISVGVTYKLSIHKG